MGRYYVINNQDREEQDEVVILDMEKKKLAFVKVEQFDTLDIGIKQGHYIDNNVEIGNSYGTLVYINKAHRFYGILVYRHSKVVLTWIAIDDFELDNRKDKISIPNELIDISVYKGEVFNRKPRGIIEIKGVKVRIRCSRDLSLATTSQIALQSFKELVGVNQQQTETIEQAEHIPIEQAEHIKQFSIKETIDPFQTEPINIDNQKDTYIMFLSMLRQNDSISLPKDYYNKLKPNVHKVIESNTAYTRYRAVVEIKENSLKGCNNIVCIADYVEDDEYTRITVLKAFNDVKLNSNDISNYCEQYRKWQQSNRVYMRV